MNNHEPSRREITTAYEALETLTDTCIHSSEQAEELQELVLRALPPKPLPTMAEVEWDDDKHLYAEAEHHMYGKVIMLPNDLFNGNIFVTFQANGERCYVYCPPSSLTPTGKRYTLTEVQE